jgi:hypothetical protein
VIAGETKMTGGTRVSEREGEGGAGLVRGYLGRLGPGHGPSWAAGSFSLFFSSVFFFFCF